MPEQFFCVLKVFASHEALRMITRCSLPSAHEREERILQKCFPGRKDKQKRSLGKLFFHCFLQRDKTSAQSNLYHVELLQFSTFAVKACYEFGERFDNRTSGHRTLAERFFDAFPEKFVPDCSLAEVVGVSAISLHKFHVFLVGFGRAELIS